MKEALKKSCKWLKLIALLFQNRRNFGTHGYLQIIERGMLEKKVTFNQQTEARNFLKKNMGFFNPQFVYDLKYVGAKQDGGYFIADLFRSPLIVSGGAGKNIDFEKWFRSNGSTVIIFDGTIGQDAFDWHGIKFERANLGKQDKNKSISLQNYLLNSKIAHESVRMGNGMYLKLDIEGSEYEVLSDLGSRLSEFDQIVVEFHNFHKIACLEFRESLQEIIDVLHANFISVCFRANNWDLFFNYGDAFAPNTFELTLVNCKHEDRLAKNHVSQMINIVNNINRIGIPNEIFILDSDR